MSQVLEHLSKRKGFTLIQLLLVIPLVGLLVSIPMYNFLGSQKERRDAKRILDISQIEKGLALYFDREGKYPEFVGCIDGSEGDKVIASLKTSGFVPSGAKIFDSVNPTNQLSCYFYIGSASRYSLRYTLESTSSAGAVGDHLNRP